MNEVIQAIADFIFDQAKLPAEEAGRIIERLNTSGPEVVQRAISTYPRLFWNSGRDRANGKETESSAEAF